MLLSKTFVQKIADASSTLDASTKAVHADQIKFFVLLVAPGVTMTPNRCGLVSHDDNSLASLSKYLIRETFSHACFRLYPMTALYLFNGVTVWPTLITTELRRANAEQAVLPVTLHALESLLKLRDQRCFA